MGLQRAHVNAINRIDGRIATSLVIFSALVWASYAATPGPPPAADVTIFIPGVIPTSVPNNAAPAFAPDGHTVFFFQSSGGSSASILLSKQNDGQWSTPKTAPFSGQYRDLEPAFAPSGRYLVFASNRPTTAGGAMLDGHYNGQVFLGSGGNLWRVDLTKKGWGRPIRLADSINSNSSVFSPAVTADGSVYFMRAENGDKFHIYRAQVKRGKFETPVLASFSDADHGDYDPAVAPDESYLIFSSGRAPAPPKSTDLFIVFRAGNGWGEPIDLRSALSENVHRSAAFTRRQNALFLKRAQPSGHGCSKRTFHLERGPDGPAQGKPQVA